MQSAIARADQWRRVEVYIESICIVPDWEAGGITQWSQAQRMSGASKNGH